MCAQNTRYRVGTYTFDGDLKGEYLNWQPCDEGVIRSGRLAIPCRSESRPWVLAATILGSSMAFIDSTVVNVALPALQSRTFTQPLSMCSGWSSRMDCFSLP